VPVRREEFVAGLQFLPLLAAAGDRMLAVLHAMFSGDPRRDHFRALRLIIELVSVRLKIPLSVALVSTL
jgi:hypothetical protein